MAHRGRGFHARGGGGGLNRGGAHRQQSNNVQRPIGYMALKDKLACESADLLLELTADKSSLRMHLENCNLHREQRNFVDMYLSILRRALECPSAPVSRNKLLGFLVGSEFMKVCVGERVMDAMHDSSEASQVALESYLVIAESLLVSIVESYRVILPVFLLLKEATNSWKDGLWLEPEAWSQLDGRVKKLLDQAKERKAAHQRRADAGQGADVPPPNDFRDLDVFPIVDDLRETKRPFLRANKIQGAYDDCDHYLDVQFRLLREDFMRPLRDGVQQYLEHLRLGGPQQRLHDIKVYSSVVILSSVASDNGLAYRIRFDTSKFKNVKWLAMSKRLLFGSLVCLSPDGFVTAYFATVTDKKPADIVKGELEILFEGPSAANIQAVDYSEMAFTMVESSAYFEAYRHILEGLKDVNPNTYPFQSYIVKCERCDGRPPAYLTQASTFDLSVISPATSGAANSSHKTKVPILSSAAWPSMEELGLDRSQLDALKLALTNEFSAIQGPPGTGKTFIGLKIVQALLANCTVWQGRGGAGARDLNAEDALRRLMRLGIRPVAEPVAVPQISPILVVCYTNHALDQFLEGILEFSPTGVVRVGGRSSSEKLKNCAISKMRSDHSAASPALRRRFFEVREHVRTTRDRTAETAKRVASCDSGILLPDILQPHMDPMHFQQLMYTAVNIGFTGTVNEPLHASRKNMDNALMTWLDLGHFMAPPTDGANPTGAQNRGQTRGNNAAAAPQEAAPHAPAAGGAAAPGGAEAAPGAVALGAAAANDDSSDEEEFLDLEDDSAFEVKQRAHDDSDEDTGQMQIHARIMEAVDDEVIINFHRAQALPAVPQDGGWQVAGRKKMSRGRVLAKLRRTTAMTTQEAAMVEDVRLLDADSRWRLYLCWVSRYRKQLSDELVQMCRGHNEQVQELKELKMQGDVSVMRNARVVGMTTTGAARYRHLLQDVKPRIVVVEEAAEVLEAHIISTLSSGCQHLILIGDHKQLRPNPAVFELARNYSLDVSLFERMVKNNLPFKTLSTQHRMRPTISKVMRHIYPELLDHDSVHLYEDVIGVKDNVFYISHLEPEVHDAMLSSHSNLHEATFVVALCRYLLQQGYKGAQISILTPYTGQIICLRKLMNEEAENYKGVRVTSIDNYQGEENDIILLSTVRSNANGRLGFINVSNRICVALSRAKKGFYVFGNFDMLAQHSDVWSKITADVQKDGCLDSKLTLVCQAHGRETNVASGKDFALVAAGGCSFPCGTRLPCGHCCERMCHAPMPGDHDPEQCQKPCTKVFDCSHRCQRTCSADCGDCQRLIGQRLHCGHRVLVPCSVSPSMFSCTAACNTTLPCGHPCSKTCGEPCNSMCTVKVTRKYECGHNVQVMCGATEADMPCPEPCGVVLKCEHICSGTCGTCHQERLHVTCSQPCGRTLICGHLCTQTCCGSCPPCPLPCENQCVHSKCNRTCGEPCVSCVEQCNWQCKHYKCQRLCHEPCNRRRCDAKCTLRVTCEDCGARHPCVGLCGEPCPRVCFECGVGADCRDIFFGEEDREDASFIQLQDCGHVFESQGLDVWMAVEAVVEAGTEEGGRSRAAAAGVSIQLKQCPKCKLHVRRNVRYGVLVNAQLNDIEKVKAQVRGSPLDIARKQKALKEYVRAAHWLDSELRDTIASNLGRRDINVRNVEVWEFQARCCEKIGKLNTCSHLNDIARSDLRKLKATVTACRGTLHEQQVEDVCQELARLECAKESALSRAGLATASADIRNELRSIIARMNDLLKGRFDAAKQREADDLLQIMRKHLGTVTREEKDMVMKAMQFTQKGHWYKCPNGHIYCIADCGGATVESICPECKSAIGGTSHTLRSDNAVATEMDGAVHSAWSEVNNLRGYGDIFH